jgi:hypothetical protein
MEISLAGSVGRVVRAGRFWRAVAGLLALAVLALLAGPAAACGGDGVGQDRHAVALDRGSDRAASLPVFHEEARAGDARAGAPACAAGAAGCCAAVESPLPLGAAPAACLSAPAGSPVRASAAAPQPDGVDGPPDPPPPRRAA